MRVVAAFLLVCVPGVAVASDSLPPGAVLRLGETRFRAWGEIRHLRFSPDGSVILGWVKGLDGELHAMACNATSGVVGVPYTVASAPPDVPERSTPAALLSGDRVVTAGPGCAGRIWDAGTRRQLAVLLGHSATVTAVAVSGDGKRIVTGSADGLIKLWDAETFHPLNALAGHTSAVRTVRVSSNGLARVDDRRRPQRARLGFEDRTGTARLSNRRAGRFDSRWAVRGTGRRLKSHGSGPRDGP